MKTPTSHFRRVSWFYLYGFPGFTRCKIIGFFAGLTGFLVLPFYRYLLTKGPQVLSTREGGQAASAVLAGEGVVPFPGSAQGGRLG